MPKIRQSTTQINFKPAINIGRIYIPAGSGGGATIGGYVAQMTGLSTPYLSPLVVVGTAAYTFTSATSTSSGYVFKIDNIETTPLVTAVKAGGGSAWHRQNFQKKVDGNLFAINRNGVTTHNTPSFAASDLTVSSGAGGAVAWNANVFSDVLGGLQTGDSNVYIIGDDGSGAYYRTLLGKTDSSGNSVSAYSYGKSGEDKIFCWATYDSSNNPIIVQSAFTTTNTEVIKINGALNNTIIWDSVLSVFLASSMSFTLSNNTYIAGRHTDNSFTLIKLNSSGAVVWSYTIAGAVSESTFNVSVYAETVSTVTSVYIAGKTGNGFLVAKYTDNGSTATQNWNNSFTPATGSFPRTSDFNGFDRPNVIVSGNNTAFIYILAAYTFSTTDPIVIRIPTSGAVPGSGIVVNSKTFNYTANAVSTVSAGVTASAGTSTATSFNTAGGTKNINAGSYSDSSITPTTTAF